MTAMTGTKSGKFPFSPAGNAGKDKQKNGA
jgi:hypothetical protein